MNATEVVRAGVLDLYDDDKQRNIGDHSRVGAESVLWILQFLEHGCDKEEYAYSLFLVSLSATSLH